MKVFYIASDNSMNYLYLRDMDREEKDCQLHDFDLSDEEIKEIYETQDKQQDRPSLYPWESYEELRERMCTMETLEAHIKNME